MPDQNDPRILEDGWYSPHAVWDKLGIDTVTQEREREHGRLAFIEKGGQVVYSGRDLLAWLKPNEKEGRPAPPKVPSRADLQIAPARQHQGAVIVAPSQRSMATSATNLAQGANQVAKKQPAQQTFELLIEAEIKKGLSRIKATSRVVAAHPDLHQALLREANGGRDPVHCLPGR
ncbi:MAG TPA: hypothetical protein VMV69_16070 [Pirellulales bacterium]|nr:hypothetical protein [Pirellulales bacterium]